MNTEAPSSQPFLGWRMAGVAFFVDFIAVGFFFYSYGIFFKSIAAEFGDSRLDVAIGITLTQGVGAMLAPFIGRALDRYPLKRIMALGALSMGTGFSLLSVVQSPFQFYLVLSIFVGFGAGAMGQLATSKLVSNWFVRKRGTALGIAATGISVSGVIMPNISAYLVTEFGWRSGFLVYGLITLTLVVPLVLRLVISRPEDVAQLPDGAKSQTELPAVKAPLRTKEFLGDRNFWLLVAIIGLLFCVQSGTLIHMVPQLTDRGISLQAASLIAAATAGCGVFGKLAYGALVDRWDTRHALWLAIGFSNRWATHHAQYIRLLLVHVGRMQFWFRHGRHRAYAGRSGRGSLWTRFVWTRHGRDAFTDVSDSPRRDAVRRMGV